MSTELINRHREGYQLTGFYGGDTRGYCLQITGDHGYVQLTREAAACLAADIFRYFLETPIPAGDAEYPQAAKVCAELYQVIGSLASDLGVFDHPKVVKALDNAANHALVHDDVLPFPSFEYKTAGDALVEMVHEMFRSGNSVPVERITITRKQYDAALAKENE